MTQLTLHDECFPATKDTTDVEVPILGCITYYNIAEILCFFDRASRFSSSK